MKMMSLMPTKMVIPNTKVRLKRMSLVLGASVASTAKKVRSKFKKRSEVFPSVSTAKLVEEFKQTKNLFNQIHNITVESIECNN